MVFYAKTRWFFSPGSLIMEKLSLFAVKEKGCAYYMEVDRWRSWCGHSEALELRKVLLYLYIFYGEFGARFSGSLKCCYCLQSTEIVLIDFFFFFFFFFFTPSVSTHLPDSVPWSLRAFPCKWPQIFFSFRKIKPYIEVCLKYKNAINL